MNAFERVKKKTEIKKKVKNEFILTKKKTMKKKENLGVI